MKRGEGDRAKCLNASPSCTTTALDKAKCRSSSSRFIREAATKATASSRVSPSTTRSEGSPEAHFDTSSAAAVLPEVTSATPIGGLVIEDHSDQKSSSDVAPCSGAFPN